MARLLFIIVILVGSGEVRCQSAEDWTPRIRGAVMMANSHVPQALHQGSEKTIIPTWGFDFDYFFHRRWSAAIQADIKLQSFEIEDGSVALERTNPIAFAGVVHYHALRHWSFYTGPGYELEHHKNFFLVKFGTEYSFEVTEKFEIALNLIFENKEGVYDTWTFGVAFNKLLWKR